MTDAGRRFKVGQFGYGKYVYLKEAIDRAGRFFDEVVGRSLPSARIEYVV